MRPGGLGMTLVGWLCAALLGACTDGTPRAAELSLTPCRLDGLGVEARCGHFTVFEDRTSGQGRRLELKLAVVPALATRPEPDPLFVLVGGPGQAATEGGAQIAEALRDVQRRRDIVLVDQRGTGGSHPLDCEQDEEGIEQRFAPRLDLAKTRDCRAALDADPAQYTTHIAMADLDDVRGALGYERINLWGGSYGTRAALVYLRQYPQRVRSLVLDGLAPFALELPLFVARDGQRALDLLLQDCAKDADCSRTFPDAKAQLQALLTRLGQAPELLQLEHPRTGRVTSVRIEREGLAAALVNLLYVPSLASLLPLAVERAQQRDFRAWVASVEAFSSAVQLSTGMFLSVVCAEDLPRISTADVERETAGTFLGSGWLSRLREQCEVWNVPELPEAHFEPIGGAVPSLLLSGNLDPVTPPRWGELVAERLTPSRHIVVPGGGHGVSTMGCMPRLIKEFLDTLDPAKLDVECLQRLQRPPFFTSMEGPSP
ncbi:MAG: hypothetical protein RL033_3591 [Pseudomonadota bacterium]|jgi:pimeloyl-ACP methyl ester carboxylesterase